MSAILACLGEAQCLTAKGMYGAIFELGWQN